MVLQTRWVQASILAVIVVASVGGYYVYNQMNKPSTGLTRVAEISLVELKLVEGVCVYNDEIYVAGWTWDLDNSSHRSYAILTKLNLSGEIVWTKTWREKDDTYAREVTCNDNGVYVVVEAKDDSYLSYKYLTKLDHDGVFQWRINSTSIGEIATSEEYVLAKRDGSLVKLDGNGETVWDKPVKGSSIFIHGDRVYVGGSTSVNASGDRDSIVSAFDLDGNMLWSTRRASTRGDEARDVCATDEGVYIVGGGTKGWSFFYVTKFSLTGEQLWDRKLYRLVNGSYSSLFSKNDIVYAAGALGDSPTSFDALTSIIDVDGSIVACDVFDEAGDEDYAYSIYCDGDRAYVVGTSCAPWPVLRHGFLLIYE
ncbi:MAG: PQQ-binding-like beta-propeller repeat protein, partial [Candidatus Bathyarchaeota archaeon]|nr:PQQ-binding-like beta-propeller repeat protein [Candidatus Bathyarchaeota archaeon]